MAVAARQRREEKVYSTTKPSVERKLFPRKGMMLNLVFQVEFERVQIGNTFINFPFTPYPLQVGLLEHGKVTK